MNRILIVDDDEAIRESLALVLEETYEVRVARNGAEALALLALEPVDAVLLDIMMPVLDGLGVLAQLRVRPNAPPVIVTSAGNDGAVRAREMGARGFLPKPFDLDTLEARLAEVIGGGSDPGSSGGGPAGGGGGLPPGKGGRGADARHGTVPLW